MLRTFLKHLFLKKIVAVFNLEQGYCQSQRFLQYQMREAQQAERKQVRHVPATRLKAAEVAWELVYC